MWLDYKGKRHFLPTEMPEEPNIQIDYFNLMILCRKGEPHEAIPVVVPADCGTAGSGVRTEKSGAGKNGGRSAGVSDSGS